QAEDGIRDLIVTGVQTCALPIYHDGAWSALGAVYAEALHKSDEAIEVYRRAVKANPDNPVFAEKLADLLIRLGRLSEAQTELEEIGRASCRERVEVWGRGLAAQK